MKNFLSTAICAAASLAFANCASAATIVVNQTLEGLGPRTQGYTGQEIAYGYGSYISPAFGELTTVGSATYPAQFLNAGDTLDATLRLVSGEMFVLQNPYEVRVAVNYLAFGNQELTSTGYISLLDDIGNPVYTGPTHTITGGGAAVSYARFSEFPSGTLTFSQIRVVTQIDGFAFNAPLNMQLTGAPFIQPTIYLYGERLTAPPQWYGVPEPSTWAMLLLGFGAAGAVLRRRRTRSSTLPRGGAATCRSALGMATPRWRASRPASFHDPLRAPGPAA